MQKAGSTQPCCFPPNRTSRGRTSITWLLPCGRRVQAIRRARELSQRELARRAGLAEPFLSRIENARAAPSLDTLQRLAAAMDVTLGDLLELQPGRFKSTCPVSHSGHCIAELIYQPGPRTKVIGERYTVRQLRLLQLANYLVQYADGETLVALETVMRGMLKLPGTRRNPRWLHKIKSGQP